MREDDFIVQLWDEHERDKIKEDYYYNEKKPLEEYTTEDFKAMF